MLLAALTLVAKVSYSREAYVRFGGDYQNVSVAWQYAWFGHPK
jgi:hypothetical protein